MIERGLYVFTFGSPDSKVDFLHIDNLVQAHRLAGQALLTPEAPAVSTLVGPLLVAFQGAVAVALTLVVSSGVVLSSRSS